MAKVKDKAPAKESPKVLHPQFVVDAAQNPTAVLLSIEEWRQLVEDLEDLADIRAYLEAKSEPSEYIPLEQVLKEIQVIAATSTGRSDHGFPQS